MAPLSYSPLPLAMTVLVLFLTLNLSLKLKLHLVYLLYFELRLIFFSSVFHFPRLCLCVHVFVFFLSLLSSIFALRHNRLRGLQRWIRERHGACVP